jgi:CopG antitoxin of type II toxin-antitoxin system
MAEDRSSISGARSYQEIGEFWDTHDLGEYWEQTDPAEFDVDIRSLATYFPVETDLATRLRSIAERRGISAETLLNLWVQEKAAEETSEKHAT